MSPPLLGGEGERKSDGSMVACDMISQNCSGLKERNYLGLSDCSSVDSSTVSSLSEENKSKFNFKATELRLGLPGSQSPERQPELCLLDEKQLFPLLPSKDGICSSSQKNVVSGNKRGFSDTMDGFSEVKSSVYAEGNWMFPAAGSDSESPESVGQGKFPVNSINAMLSSRPSGTQPTKMKDVITKSSKDQSNGTNGASQNHVGASNKSSAPAAK